MKYAPALIEAAEKTPDQMRASILKLESAMLAMPKEQQVEFPLEHFFVPGVYMRTLFMPKNAVLTGKIHKTHHFFILLSGEITIWNGGGMVRVKAPKILKSVPGTKRAIFAHEESLLMNVHHNPSDEQDTDKIDDVFTVQSFEELPQHIQEEMKKIEGEIHLCHSSS